MYRLKKHIITTQLYVLKLIFLHNLNLNMFMNNHPELFNNDDDDSDD